MPKKKKGGKLAKMTEEEKKVYLEQQRIAEEEMKKKKEEMLAQFFKDKLAKEEKMSKHNLNKIDHQWRLIMREVKSNELKKELEILHQTFERVVDRKNSIIRSLGKDIEEAEEQYNMSINSHLQNIDALLEMQKDRISLLCNEFGEEKKLLVEEFDLERESLYERHQKELNELQDVIHAMEQTFIEREDEANQEFQTVRDEIRAKNLEDKHTLRVQLEGVVEDLWGQFTAALAAYQEATEERRQAYEALKAKDEKSAKEILQQSRKLQTISENASVIKMKMAENQKGFSEQSTRMKEDREIMLLNYNELKNQVNKIRTTQKQQLTGLTALSNDALKKLKEKTIKAERILKLAEMCRKLESEEEKVLPYYDTNLTEQEQDEIAQVLSQPPAEEITEVMYKYTALENFWKRYNKVLLDRVALEKERSVVGQQNAQLRGLLKQYLNEISVNDESLERRPNPLIMYQKEQSDCRLNVPVTDKRVKTTLEKRPVIEAAHIRNISA